MRLGKLHRKDCKAMEKTMTDKVAKPADPAPPKGYCRTNIHGANHLHWQAPDCVSWRAADPAPPKEPANEKVEANAEQGMSARSTGDVDLLRNGPNASEPPCWHRNIGENTICKDCGQKAAVKFPVAAPVDQQEGQQREWLKYWEDDENTRNYKNDTRRAYFAGFDAGRASLASSPQPGTQPHSIQEITEHSGTSREIADFILQNTWPRGTCHSTVELIQAYTAAMAASSPESSQPALTAEEFAERCGILPIHRPVAIRFAEAYLGLATASSQGVNEALAFERQKRNEGYKVPNLEKVNAELLGALKAICEQSESWHTMHGHGPDSVQCDGICELIPRMRKAIARAEEQG